MRCAVNGYGLGIQPLVLPPIPVAENANAPPDQSTREPIRPARESTASAEGHQDLFRPDHLDHQQTHSFPADRPRPFRRDRDHPVRSQGAGRLARPDHHQAEARRLQEGLRDHPDHEACVASAAWLFLGPIATPRSLTGSRRSCQPPRSLCPCRPSTRLGASPAVCRPWASSRRGTGRRTP
jgi:hypothetical protein